MAKVKQHELKRAKNEEFAKKYKKQGKQSRKQTRAARVAATEAKWLRNYTVGSVDSPLPTREELMPRRKNRAV